MCSENNIFTGLYANSAKLSDITREHCQSVENIIKQLESFDGRLIKQDLVKPLQDAFQKLQEDLKQPLVRIAAIGTTSSAKSSLLNFLCGVPLLPTGVQEKSAGSVRIINSPNISVEIEETEGAVWRCGNIEVADYEEIREVLDEIMRMYRKAVNKGEDLEAPSVIVHYPIQLSEILNLPANFQLELMDLPGLKFTGDERNLRVMRQCSDAMCLVTLGSQETDPLRQQVLLEEALEQVRNIGSPIPRMLFVITRVDEFLLREPQNWPENEDEYVEDRINAILEELNSQIPGDDISSVAHARISPMPALYSLDLLNPSKRDTAYDSIQRFYFGLVKGGKGRDWRQGIDPQLDLSTDKFRLWTEEDWSKIADQLQETSGAITFLATLNSHIANNLPSITLPRLISPYIAIAEESSCEIKNLINLLRASISQDFEGQQERLKKTGEELRKVNEEGSKRLQEFMAYCYNNLFQQSTKEQQKEKFHYLKEKFPTFSVPGIFIMAQWPTLMREAYLWPIKSIRERITNGTPLPTSLPHKAELDQVIIKLTKLGYNKQMALNGGSKTLKTATDRELFINTFKKMSELCNKSLKTSLKNEFAKQTDNILLALEEVQDAYLSMIDEMLEHVPEEFAHIVKISPDALKKFATENTPETVNPGIVLKTTIKKFKESKVLDNLAKGGNWLGDALTNLYRKLTGNTTRTVEVEKTVYLVEMPSLLKYEREMTVNFQKSFEALQKQMLAIASTQIFNFLDNIHKCQDSRIAAYENMLEKVMNDKKQIVTHQYMDLDSLLAHLNSATNSLKKWQQNI